MEWTFDEAKKIITGRRDLDIKARAIKYAKRCLKADKTACIQFAYNVDNDYFLSDRTTFGNYLQNRYIVFRYWVIPTSPDPEHLIFGIPTNEYCNRHDYTSCKEIYPLDLGCRFTNDRIKTGYLLPDILSEP